MLYVTWGHQVGPTVSLSSADTDSLLFVWKPQGIFWRVERIVVRSRQITYSQAPSWLMFQWNSSLDQLFVAWNTR